MSRIKNAIPHVPAHTAVRSAFNILDFVQQLPKPDQVAGTAVLFVALCEGLSIDPSQLINASQRRLKDDDNFVRTEVRALREYIAKELRA